MYKKLEKILDKGTFRNGFLGTLGVLDLPEDKSLFIFCNEREYKGEGFLFKCSENCKHNVL